MPAAVPVFLAYGAPDGTVKADFPTQIRAWVRHLAGETGCNLEIRIVEAGQDRSNPQSRAFHGAVSTWILHKFQEDGTKLDIEDVKLWLLAKAFGWTEFHDLETGEVIKRPAELHTSELTRAEFCLLMETTIDTAAGLNYIMPTPDEYKAAKAYVLKKAAAKAERCSWCDKTHDGGPENCK